MIEKIFNLVMLIVLTFGTVILFTIAVCWKMMQALFQLAIQRFNKSTIN